MAITDIRPHTLTGQSVWQDLLRLLKEGVMPEVRSKPTLRRRENRGYWHDRYRQAERIVERYMDEDSEDLRQRRARHDVLRQAAQDRRAETSRRSGFCAARAG